MFILVYITKSKILWQKKGKKILCGSKKDQCDVSAGRTVERERKQRLGLTTEAMRKMRFFTCGNGD